MQHTYVAVSTYMACLCEMLTLILYDYVIISNIIMLISHTCEIHSRHPSHLPLSWSRNLC